MAIPTQEMFDSFKKEIIWNDELESSNIRFLQTELSRSEVISMVQNWYQKRHAYFRCAEKHELVKTLEDQASWIRAEKSLFTKLSMRNENDWVNEVLNKIYLKKNEEDFSYANYRLYKFLSNDPKRLNKNIYDAFYNYFYTDKWANIAKKAALAENIIKKAHDAITDLESLGILNEFADEKFLQTVSLKRFNAGLGKLLEKDGIRFDIPIVRQDKTLKERGLIYDLSKAFQPHFRSNKSKAIYHFLEVEGVKNSLELRTIDRLLSSWKNTRLEKLERIKLNRQLKTSLP